MIKKQLISNLIVVTLISTSAFIASCTNIDRQESTGQYIDSSVITTKVKTKLLSDNYVKGLPITVKTYKNTVQLSGFVDNKYQKRRAINIAKSIEGVTDVEDSLVIKSH